MRAFVLFVIVCALVAGTYPTTLAQEAGVRVFLDGNRIPFDQPPVMLSGRVLVPLRGIFERMGATVNWEPDTRTVIAVRGTSVVELVIGRRSARVDNQIVPLDVPATIIGARTLVPLRFISESLGATVQWQEETRTVLIFSPGAPVAQPPVVAPPQPAPAPAPPAQTFSGTLVQIRTGDNPMLMVERGQTLVRVPSRPTRRFHA